MAMAIGAEMAVVQLIKRRVLSLKKIYINILFVIIRTIVKCRRRQSLRILMSLMLPAPL